MRICTFFDSTRSGSEAYLENLQRAQRPETQFPIDFVVNDWERGQRLVNRLDDVGVNFHPVHLLAGIGARRGVVIRVAGRSSAPINTILPLKASGGTRPSTTSTNEYTGKVPAG